jgi:hypothetical protein
MIPNPPGLKIQFFLETLFPDLYMPVAAQGILLLLLDQCSVVTCLNWNQNRYLSEVKGFKNPPVRV